MVSWLDCFKHHDGVKEETMSEGSRDMVCMGMPKGPALFNYILCLLNFHELLRD